MCVFAVFSAPHAALAQTQTQTQAQAAGPTQRLFLAVRAGDMPGLEQSLLEGANTAARNTKGLSAFDLAGELGRFGMAQILRMQPPPPAGAENRVIEEIPYEPPSAAAPGARAGASSGALGGADASAAASLGARMISSAEIVVDLAAADPFGAAALGIAPLEQPTALVAGAVPPPTPAAAPSSAPSITSAPEPAAISAAPAPGETQIAAAPRAAAQAAPPPTDASGGNTGGAGKSDSFFSRLRDTLGFGSDGEEESSPTAEAAAEAQNAQTASAPAAAPAAEETEVASEPTADGPLALPALAVGAAPNLGHALALSGEALRQSCITRRSGAVVVCLEPIDWPTPLAPMTQRSKSVVQAHNAIVRYDNGTATRYHVLFPSDVYEAVKAHYIAKYGLPGEVHGWRIAPIKGLKENQAALWGNINPADEGKSWLEVRKFDDTRGGFPDDKNGVLMLYNTGGGPVFPLVSIFDLAWLRPAGSPAIEP
ncbi:MAG: hypothetical protein ACYYKD_07910 [Rhodospirillales bacterium]